MNASKNLALRIQPIHMWKWLDRPYKPSIGCVSPISGIGGHWAKKHKMTAICFEHLNDRALVQVNLVSRQLGMTSRLDRTIFPRGAELPYRNGPSGIFFLKIHCFLMPILHEYLVTCSWTLNNLQLVNKTSPHAMLPKRSIALKRKNHHPFSDCT